LAEAGGVDAAGPKHVYRNRAIPLAGIFVKDFMGPREFQRETLSDLVMGLYNPLMLKESVAELVSSLRIVGKFVKIRLSAAVRCG
jgi:hypothetical protein